MANTTNPNEWEELKKRQLWEGANTQEEEPTEVQVPFPIVDTQDQNGTAATDGAGVETPQPNMAAAVEPKKDQVGEIYNHLQASGYKSLGSLDEFRQKLETDPYYAQDVNDKIRVAGAIKDRENRASLQKGYAGLKKQGIVTEDEETYINNMMQDADYRQGVIEKASAYNEKLKQQRAQVQKVIKAQQAARGSQPAEQAGTGQQVASGTQATGVPEGFGQLNITPEIGLAPAFQEETRKRRLAEEAKYKTEAQAREEARLNNLNAALQGNREAMKTAGLVEMSAQLRDRIDYLAITGKELKDDVLDMTQFGVAPTAEKTADGQVLKGMTNDQIRANTQKYEQERVWLENLDRQIDEKQAEVDKRQKELDSIGQETVTQFSSNFGVYTQTNRSADREAAVFALGQAKKQLEALKQEKEGGRHGFWNAIGETITDSSTWLLGFDQMHDVAYMYTLKKKIDEGEALTDYEKDAMQAMIDNQEVQQRLDDDSDWLYRAGVVTATQIPFMAQIMATGGFAGIAEIGAAGGERWAAAFANKFGEDLLVKRMAANTLKGLGVAAGDIAAGFASANTTGIGNTIVDTLKRATGQAYVNEKGEYQFKDADGMLRAFLKAEVSQTKEFATERFGEHIPSLTELHGWIAKSGNTGAKMARALSGVAGNSVTQATRKFLSKAGMQGIVPEIIEEEIGIPIDLAIGDTTWEEAFGKKNQWDIIGGMILSVGAMHAATATTIGAGKVYNTAQYYKYKNRADERGRVASFRVGEDRWSPLKDRIDMTATEDMSALWEEIRTSDMEVKEKRAVFDYINALTMARSYNLGMLFQAKAIAENPEMSPEPATISEKAKMNAMASEDKGYNIEQPRDMNDAKLDLDYKKQRVMEIVGEKAGAILDSQEHASALIDQVLGNEELDDDQRQVIFDYINAKQVYDGMINRVKDDIESRIAFNDEKVDENADEDGMIMTATMKNGGQVYVVRGNVAVDGEDNIITSASDATVVVRDQVTGEIKMVAPSDIHSIDSTQSADQVKSNGAAQIRMQMAQERAAQIDGTLPFVPGDVYQMEDAQGMPVQLEILADNGNGSVQVNYNGQPTTMTKDAIQKMNDAVNQQRIAVVNEENQSRAGQKTASQRLAEKQAKKQRLNQPAEQTETEPVSQTAEQSGTGHTEGPRSALDQIPVAEDGTRLYQEADPEVVYDALVEQAGEEGAQQVAAVESAKAHAIIDQLNKQVPTGNTTDEVIANAKQIAQDKEVVHNAAAFWDAVANVPEQRGLEQIMKEVLESRQDKTGEGTPAEKIDELGKRLNMAVGEEKAAIAQELSKIIRTFADENGYDAEVVTEEEFLQLPFAQERAEQFRKEFASNDIIAGCAVGGKIYIIVEQCVKAGPDTAFDEVEGTLAHEATHQDNSADPTLMNEMVQYLGTSRGVVAEALGIIGRISGVNDYTEEAMKKMAANDEEGALKMIADELMAHLVQARTLGTPVEAFTKNQTITNIANKAYEQRELNRESRNRSRRNEDVHESTEGEVRSSQGNSGTESGNDPVRRSERSRQDNGALSAEGVQQDVERMVKEEGLSEDVAQDLADAGLTMTGGAVMNHDAAALKAETGYKTPNEQSVADEILYSHGTRLQWRGDYLGQKPTKRMERIAKAVLAWYDRAAMDALTHDYMSYEMYPAGGLNKDGEGPLRKNVEYVFTFDLDTTCPRTMQYLYFADQIEKKIGRPMTQNECIQLIEEMRAHGLAIPCVYCYAENKRQALKNYYNNFIAYRLAVLAAETEEEAEAAMYGHADDNPKNPLSKAAKEVLKRWRDTDIEFNQYRPTVQQLTTDYNEARNAVLYVLDYWKKNGAVSEKDSDDKLIEKVCANYRIDTKKNAPREDKNRMSSIASIVNDWRYDELEGVPHHNYDAEKQVNGVLSQRLRNGLALWDEMKKYGASASSAHNAVRYMPYTNELTKISEDKKHYINGMGGLRMHSTNDFRIDYVGDYFQLIADMAKDGWFGHTYTKSPLMVEIFGRTGYRINMSCAAYDEYEYDENGDYVMEDYTDRDGKVKQRRKVKRVVENHDEGFYWAEAQRLRSQYGNAGAMMMTTSHAQLQYALDSEWIDMIIPFHSSGLPVEVMSMRAWEDAQSVQNESFYNADDMRAELKDMDFSDEDIEFMKTALAGKKLTKKAQQAIADNDKEGIVAVFLKKTGGASSDDVKEMFYMKHPEMLRPIKYTKSNGEVKTLRPHFLPGMTRPVKGRDDIEIPGWATSTAEDPKVREQENLQNYFALCRQYGVHPRFHGIMVKDKAGNDIPIEQHPGYIKLIKETARMDTMQEAVKFNLDEPDPSLEIRVDKNGEITIDANEGDMSNINPQTGEHWTPLEYAFFKLKEHAAGGGYENYNQDINNVIPNFIRNVIQYKEQTGHERPLSWISPNARAAWQMQVNALEAAAKNEKELMLMPMPYHEAETELDEEALYQYPEVRASKRTVSSGEASETVTKSEAFKNWFGDWENDPENASKVVDAEGKPLVVYHGTHSRPFTEFIDNETDGEGLSWASTSREHAAIYGSDDYMEDNEDLDAVEQANKEGYIKDMIYPLYLDMRNPLELGDIEQSCDSDNFARIAAALGTDAETLFKDCAKGADDYWESDELSGVDIYNVTRTSVFADKLRAAGYDGVTAIETPRIDDKETPIRTYGVLSSKQIKSATANNGEFDPNNPDIRFRKSLAGVHNISEDKLRKALKLGGLANPSAAVVDTEKNPWSQYGEISLIMPSSLVDAKTGRNAGTFDRDIWSPMYPPVTYTSTKESDAKTEELVKGVEDKALAREIKTDIWYSVQGNSYNNGAKYLFLKEKGLAPEIVMKEPKKKMTSQQIDDIFGFSNPTYEDYQNLPKEKKEYLNALELTGGVEENANNLLKKAELRDTIAGFLADEKTDYQFKEMYDTAKRASEEVAKPDYRETLSKAERILLANDLENDFNQWWAGIFENMGYKETIQVGWNERTGDRIYKPNTLANVSAYMKKQGMVGSKDHFGYNASRAFGSAPQRMSTLAQIVANKERLDEDGYATGNDTDYSRLIDRINSAANIFLTQHLSWEDTQAAFGYMEDIISSNRSIDDIVGEYNSYHKNNPIELTEEERAELESIREESKTVKVPFFETKFNRPVGIEEFVSAVVPEKTSPDVINGLKANGLEVHTYDPTKEGDRERVQREATDREDVLFRKTYHGTAADFRKFDHSFMGTGEGAQMFGWGTYVSGSEGVSRSYADVAKRTAEERRDNQKGWGRNGEIFKAGRDNGKYTVAERNAIYTLLRNNNDFEEALREVRLGLYRLQAERDSARNDIEDTKENGGKPTSAQEATLIVVERDIAAYKEQLKVLQEIETGDSDITYTDNTIGKVTKDGKKVADDYTSVPMVGDAFDLDAFVGSRLCATGGNWDMLKAGVESLKEHSELLSKSKDVSEKLQNHNKEIAKNMEKVLEVVNGNHEGWEFHGPQKVMRHLYEVEIPDDVEDTVEKPEDIVNRLAGDAAGKKWFRNKRGFAGINLESIPVKYAGEVIDWYNSRNTEDPIKDKEHAIDLLMNREDIMNDSHNPNYTELGELEDKLWNETQQITREASKIWTKQRENLTPNYLSWDETYSDNMAYPIEQRILEACKRLIKKNSGWPGHKPFLSDVVKMINKGNLSWDTGGRLYKKLAGELENDKMASLLLSEAGFTGIKVSVGFGHRGQTQPTKNYVIFKEEDAQITNYEEHVRWSKRKGPAPKKTGIGYKVFYKGKDGKLYPPMVANPNGEDTPVGVWLDADAAPIVGQSKTGRNKVKAGGKGTQGGSGSLAYRPGWHLGEIPYALQFNRKDENGEKTLFPKDFVWAEVEYAKDVDYQDEAYKAGINKNGKYQHSLAGLPYLPVDGSYMYRTNPNPETDPWIITGSMKVNRILDKSEVDEIVRAAGREPQKVEGEVRFAKKSNLTPKQQKQVKSENFKRWFGDWEKAQRIERLRISDVATITGDEFEISGEPKKSAFEYAKKLQGEYTNADTGMVIQLQRGRKNGGIKEVLQHNYKDIPHLKSVAAIPQIIEKSIYITSEPNFDKNTNPDVVEYQHYVCGLTIGNEDYTVHAIVTVDNKGNRYYDHNLTYIEKEKLLDQINGGAVTEGFGTMPGTKPTTSSEYKVNKLISILQTNSSKVVDENGEPLVVYHGGAQITEDENANLNGKPFYVFNENAHFGSKEQAQNRIQAYINNMEDQNQYADEFGFPKKYNAGEYMYEVYLDIKNPMYTKDAGENWPNVIKKAKELGHDGIIYDNEWEGDGKSYIIFSPNQVKSATENNGDFDPENPDIRYSKKGTDADTAGTVAEKTSAAQSMVKVLNIGGNTAVHAVAEIPEGVDKDAKGWYDPQTDTIHIVPENCIDANEAKKTVLHEAVAHYGLRNVMGQDALDKFLDDLYMNNEDIREEVNKLLPENGFDYMRATEEYCARMAEQEIPTNIWQKTKAAFKMMLKGLGIDVRLGDNEILYMLWKSKRALNGNDIFDRAADISKQIDLGTGVYYSKRVYTNAKDLYETETGKNSLHNREQVQDRMIAVRTLEDAIGMETGKKISPRESAYLAENRMHGMNKTEAEYFDLKHFTPMNKAIAALMKSGKMSYEQVEQYVMMKHGLERNAWFGMKAALDEIGEALAARGAKPKAVQTSKETLYNDYLKDPDLKKLKNDYIDGKIPYSEYEKQRRDLLEKHIPGTLAKIAELGDKSGLSQITEDDTNFEAIAAKAVDDIESQNKAQCDELWKRINGATKWSVNKSRQSGRMTKEGFDIVNKMFDFYVPLRGWNDTNADEVYTYMNGGKPAMNTVKPAKMKGRTSQADGPFGYIGSMAASEIVLGNKNLYLQYVYRMALNHPTSLLTVSEMWYENLGTEDNPNWQAAVPRLKPDMSADEVHAEIERFNTDMRKKQRAGMAARTKQSLPEVTYPATFKQQQEHMIPLQVDGEDVIVFVNGNPKAAQALNGTNKVAGSWESTREINQAIGQMLTSKNPAFVPANFVRDMLGAQTQIFIKESPAYIAKFNWNMGKLLRPRVFWGGAMMPGLMHKWENGTLDESKEMEHLFKLFMENGGETGFVAMLTNDAFEKDIKKKLKKISGHYPTWKQGWDIFSDSVEFLNRTVEDATRFITFVTSMQMGKGLEQSIDDAKNISLNFNRSGAGGELQFDNKAVDGFFKAFVPRTSTLRNHTIFVNPAIQDLQIICSLIKKHPVKFSAMAVQCITIGLLQPFFNAWLGGGDDEYWKLPKWVRRNNFILRVPGTDVFIKVPLPQGFRMWNGLGETIASQIEGRSEENIALELTSSALGLLPVDPTGNNGNPIVSMMPSWGQGIAQVAFNENFLGYPIRKEMGAWGSGDFWPEALKTTVGTPDWMVNSSEYINGLTGGDKYKKGFIEDAADKWLITRWLSNPSVINHLFSGWFGGPWNFFNGSIDVITNGITGEQIKLSKFPVVSRFVARPSEKTTEGKLSEEYYEVKRQSDKILSHFNGWMKDAEAGDEKAAKKLDEISETPEFQQANLVHEYANEVDNVRQELKATNDPETRKQLSAAMDDIVANMMKDIEKLKNGKLAKLEEYDDASLEDQGDEDVTTYEEEAEDTFGEEAED